MDTNLFTYLLNSLFPIPLNAKTEQTPDLLSQLLSSRQDYILIACMPKSGSTFLLNVLSELSGYSIFHMNYLSTQNEQDLYLPRVLQAFPFKNISHQHVKATSGNKEILRSLNIHPLIMVRNLFDVVVSVRDHFYQETIRVPIGYVTPGFFRLNDEEQINYIIDIIVPWYLNFYVSWYDSCFIRNEINALWIRYEDLNANKPETIKQISDYYRLEKDINEITAIIEKLESDKKRIRYNKGNSGRGNDYLTAEQKQKIIRLTSYYPDIDFSMIGIETPKIVQQKNDMVRLAEFRENDELPDFLDPRLFYKLYKRPGDIYIFGTGSASSQTFQSITDFINTMDLPNQIVEFWDNDSERWGKTYHGLPICIPKKQLPNQSDVILIASSWFREIRTQLIELGYSSESLISAFRE